MHNASKNLLFSICLTAMALAATSAEAKQYNLFLVAGQSNAVGYATTISQLTASSADAKIPFFFDCGDPGYDAGVHDSSSMGAWTTLKAQPIGNPTSGARQYGNFQYQTGGFGPEMSIGRDLYNAGVNNVAIMKFAYSGTSFRDNDWNKGNPLYNDMKSRYAQAVSQLAVNGDTVKLAGLFWIQGESDYGSTTYQADFTKFIADVRADYNAPKLPVFCGFNAAYDPTCATVVQAQQAVAASDPLVWYVGLQNAARVDSIHFSGTGELQVGDMFASTYIANVPEPATLSLLSIGALAILKRRK